MYSSLENILEERRCWRVRKAEFFQRERRRDTKVLDRCTAAFRNLSESVHRAIIRHNNLGKRTLGIRRTQDKLEVHWIGSLPALLCFSLDAENYQIVYRSPSHDGSSLLEAEGTMSAPFLGSVLVLDPDGRMIRFRYEDAAEYFVGRIAL
jgi:hypothetical protein